MRVSVDGRVVAEGRAVDLRNEPISPETIRTTIREESTTLSVDCPSPTRWWASLGCPTDETAPLDRVVAAARSRGHHVPAERALARAQRELRAVSVEPVAVDAVRRRLADAGEDVERLREDVATARGRLQSRREMDANTVDAEAALEAAVQALSEAETERLAAEQAHDVAQRRAREARAARERRLRLQDRVANRRREARRGLAECVRETFGSAVESIPGEATLSVDPLCVEGDDVTAALAAARIAELRAPVVDATGRFDSARAGKEALRGPVVLV